MRMNYTNNFEPYINKSLFVETQSILFYLIIFSIARYGFPQMRYHDLRHSTASILVDRGWDINDIKEWLGHADISTTANIYAHISHRRKVSLAKSLEGSLTFEQSVETTA